MKVYHGSDTVIDAIDLNKCKPGRDFGQGFYVTKYLRQAEEMAIRVARWGSGIPCITEYKFNEYAYRDTDLKVLRLDGYCEEWFDFVILNRQNIDAVEPQAHDYDIVEGAVADDEINTQIFAYLRRELTKDQFFQKLFFKKPMHQICFCSVQSLQMLTPLKEDADAKMMFIDRDIVEALTVDFALSEARATELYFTSKTYLQLIDENSEYYKKRWTEIYSLLLHELKLKKM